MNIPENTKALESDINNEQSSNKIISCHKNIVENLDEKKKKAGLTIKILLQQLQITHSDLAKKTDIHNKNFSAGFNFFRPFSMREYEIICDEIEKIIEEKKTDLDKIGQYEKALENLNIFRELSIELSSSRN